MYSRHTEIPPLEVRPGWQVEARYFNQASLALRVLGPEIRLSLPLFRSLDLILQEDAWVVIDRIPNDMPVLVWADFHVAGRRSLHLPVACDLLLYHSMATLVMNRALVGMAEILRAERVRAEPKARRGQVVPFRHAGAGRWD